MRNLVAAFAVVTTLTLGACVVPAARDSIDTLSNLGADEVVIVGRVELSPPLRPGEQKIKTLNSGSFENKVFLLADPQGRTLTKEPELADYAGRVEATLGKNFFVRSKNEPFHIIGGMMYLDIGSREMNRVYFPGGLRVSTKAGDKAIYIGTIRYHRDEFWEITKIEIADDYTNANTEFKKKFGNTATLRKALLTKTSK